MGQWNDVDADAVSRNNLAGTWYLNGDSGKRVEITSSRDGLHAKNERGHTSRLQTDPDGDIRALDWEGVFRGMSNAIGSNGRMAQLGRGHRISSSIAGGKGIGFRTRLAL